MLDGYDITNMSNDDINRIMKGQKPYDPDERITVGETVEAIAVKNPKRRIKIFSAIHTDYLEKIVNQFFDDTDRIIEVQDIIPYTFTDKNATKHCCLIRFVEW